MPSHAIRVELAIGVAPGATVQQAHELADRVRREPTDHVEHVTDVIVETRPSRGVRLPPATKPRVRSLRERDHPDSAPASMRAPIRYARSGDVNIAYQVTGEGELDLVLVPGFVSHLELDWDDPRSAYFLDRLGSFTRLIRFDKRGTGLSDRPGGLPDLETRMDDVRAVLDAVGSERAALFGYSEGGPLSILFAATRPERVSELVLYGTYAEAAALRGLSVGANRGGAARLRSGDREGVGVRGRPASQLPERR
jgi:hypothetical protein